MRLGRETTTPLQAHFLPPSVRAINPTPLFLQAVRKLSAPTDAVRLLQATASAQCYILYSTCYSSICMSENVNIFVSQNSPTHYAEVSFSSRRFPNMNSTGDQQSPLRTVGNNCRIRSNADLDRLINIADVARFMKDQRLGHTQSMGSSRAVNGIMGSRQTGRPRIRCNDM